MTTDGSGSQIVRVYSGSVNYPDQASGDWEAIDDGLVATPDGYRNKASWFDVTVPAKLGSDDVQVSQGGDRVGFSLRGANAMGKVSGSKITYASALPGVDVSYDVRSDFLKELVTLADKSAPRSFVFDLNLSAGLHPDVLRSGDIALRDASDNVKMTIPAPFMTDANGKTSQAVKFALAKIGNRWRLTMTADDSWLDSGDRAFPVAIDPQVFPSNQVDCKLDQSTPTTGYCSSSDLTVGGSSGSEKRSVLQFDVASAVPRGATVTHAALGMKLLSQSGGAAVPINVYRLTTGFSATATWNSPWTAPGGDFAATNRCEHCATAGGPVGGGDQPGSTSYWNIRGLVADEATGSPANLGMLLKAASVPASGGNVISYGSSAQPSGSQPYIDIRYELRMGVLPNSKYDTQRLNDRMSLGVNLSSGNLMLRATDVSVPGGLGPALSVGRTYNALQGNDFTYGIGWTMDTGADVSLERTPQDDVVYHGPSGYRALFVKNADGSYVTPPGFNADLKAISPSGWAYTEHASQRKLTFDINGRMTRDEDRNGRAITFAYSGSSNQLTSITDAEGRTTGFAYSGSHISQMTDSGGRTYKYFYTGGLLNKYTDPENHDTLFDYDTVNRLQLITTPAGHKTKITYYTSGANSYRVQSVIRATNPTAAFASLTGPTTQYSYTQNQDGSGQSSVTDPDSHPATVTNFETHGWPIDSTDGNGHKVASTYTASGGVQNYEVPGSGGTTGTTPNGNLDYDTDNNLQGSYVSAAAATDASTCKAVPSAPCVRATAKYGEPARVSNTTPGYQYLQTSSMDPQAHSQTQSYDAHGNPTSIASSLGTITLAYDSASAGKLTGVTDPNNHATSYTYFASGDLQKITPPTPLGTTQLTYTTSLSRIATVTDANAKVRTLSYDNLDRVTKITYQDGSYVQFIYDADGNLSTRNDTVGGNSSYGYDELSRLTSESLPGGLSNTYTYDNAGNLKTIVDASGTTTYTYDNANLNKDVVDPAQSTGNGTGLTYDANNHQTQTLFHGGTIITRTYDDAGRLTRIRAGTSASLGSYEDHSYGYTDTGSGGYGEGEVILTTVDNKALTTTYYTRDALGRLVRARIYNSSDPTPPTPTTICASDTRLSCYEYTYDAAGNRLTTHHTATGGVDSTSTMTYNNANEICWQKAGVIATPTCATVPSGATTYSYDANGNQTTRSAPTARTLGYNLRDQLTNLNGTAMGYLGAGSDQLVTQGATANNLQYNVLGLSRRVSGATTNYYTRDATGNPLSQRTASQRDDYAPDNLGSILRTIDDQTNATTGTWSYDPDGNTTNTTGTSTSPLRYAGGYLATGGLYHYGQRYYDPTDARWTQQDPLNQATDLLQTNRYSYAGADPVDRTDLSGTDFLGIGHFLSKHKRGVITGLHALYLASSGGAAGAGCAASATILCPAIVGGTVVADKYVEHVFFKGSYLSSDDDD